MNASPLVPEVVQRRLEILFHKLEDAGQYVGANTVAQAQQLITDLTGVARPAGRGPAADQSSRTRGQPMTEKAGCACAHACGGKGGIRGPHGSGTSCQA